MPPPTNRDLFIVLVDLKTSSRFEQLDTLHTIKLYELLSSSKNLCSKIYLVNSTHTSNSHNYKGIQIFDVGQDGSPTIPELPTETGESDFVEAIQVAVTDLESDAGTTNSKVVTLKILFLTDLSSFQKTENSSKLTELIADLNRLDIFLYIVGPDVGALPQALLSFNDVTNWMKQLCSNLPTNLNVVKTILSEVPHTIVCNYDIGLHLFYSYAYFKARQPWNVPLDIGDMFKLEVSTIKITEANAPIKLKNTVKTDNYKWVAEEEQDKTYDLGNTVSGIVRHGKFIAIESDATFKTIGPRSFRILFITSLEKVPEYFLHSEGSYVVLPAEKQSDDYYTFFKTFLNELALQNMYVVARRVYNTDNNPQYVALIPRPEQTCFVMCGLPYAQDIRYPYQEKTLAAAPKTEINQNVYDFLDSINVSGAKCQLEPPILAPRMMVYPSGLAIINKVKEKIKLPGVVDNKVGIIDIKPLKEKKIKEEWLDREVEPIANDDEANLADFNDVEDFQFD